MMKTIICDIDGVIADNRHRLHYMEEKDYDKFYSDEEVMKDGVLPAGLELINSLIKYDDADSPVGLIFITGRNERCMDATNNWLHMIGLGGKYRLFMRHDGDYRPSPEVKLDLMEELFISCMAFFIDDDPANVIAVEEKYPMIKGIIFGTDRC